jgi:hypothetical protein
MNNYLSEPGFAGLKDLQDFAMQRKNPVNCLKQNFQDLRIGRITGTYFNHGNFDSGRDSDFRQNDGTVGARCGHDSFRVRHCGLDPQSPLSRPGAGLSDLQNFGNPELSEPGFTGLKDFQDWGDEHIRIQNPANPLILKIPVQTKGNRIAGIGNKSKFKILMRLTLKRRFRGEDYTIGSLYLNGEYFCDTLEDTDRGLSQSMSPDEIKRIKIPHETAIPTGEYKVIANLSPAKKRMLPRLLDVPGFSGILIHRGNTKHDSSGCILVGENKVKGKVINSTGYEKWLVEILIQAQENDEEISIEIINKQ